MDTLQDSVHKATARFERVPDLLAEDIEANLRQGKRSRLANVLSEASADSLEIAVRRRPQAVVQAVRDALNAARGELGAQKLAREDLADLMAEVSLRLRGTQDASKNG